MKPSVIIGLGGLAILPAMVAEPLKMRDAASHEQLAVTLRSSASDDPMRGMSVVETKDPSTENQPVDILKSSDIICFNGLATLVPKRAILQVPASCRRRLTFVPGSKILSWDRFLESNRGWISTIEVSRIQAEGGEMLDEKTRERIAKSGNLIVATFKGGPISVLPPRSVETSETKPATTRGTAKP
jgi:hypothetical protein